MLTAVDFIQNATEEEMATTYTPSDKSIELAIDLAKAGMPSNTGILMTNPELVTKFIEVVANKIESLRRAG